MKFSKFVHLIELENDITAIHHSISLSTIYTKISKKHLDFFYISHSINEIKQRFIELKDSNLSFFERLREKKFLVPSDYNEKEIANNIFKINSDNLKINTAHFIITDSCNLSCKYCVILNDSRKIKSNIDIKKIPYYVKYFYKVCDKNSSEINIMISGGEPFLFPEIVYKIWEECNSVFPKNINWNFVILTNSLLIKKEMISFLKKDNIQIVISLDGDKKINDENRIDLSNNGTYERICQKIKLLRANNISFSISTTIGIGNEDKTFSIFNDIVNQTQTTNIGINYIMDTNSYKKATVEYSQKVTEGLIEIHKYYHGKNIYEDRLSRKIKAYITKNPIIKDCSGCGRQIVFTPNNKIGPCQSFYSKDKYFIEFSRDIDLNKHSFQKWNDISPFNNDECLNCIALGFCGGGCPYRAYQKSQNLNSLDKVFCIHSKMLLHHFIKFSFFKNKNC